MSTASSFEEDYDIRFLLPQGVGETEDVENYRVGGFHPTHLGDKFDGGRYRVVHKLGAGGFSTVWLARDEQDNRWVALKVVSAEHSNLTANKTAMVKVAMHDKDIQSVVQSERQFFFDGPNGHHLCLVLPVLGPSLSELSQHFTCRLTAQFCQNVAWQATKAMADLHHNGLCHGDFTTGNLLLTVPSIDDQDEDGIYRLFGQPVTGVLETESGTPPGHEAPRYIVKAIDFLSTPFPVFTSKVKLADFDQCFLTSSPPQELLGTPVDFLAPEVAVGRAPGPASDVWALACSIFRMRAGDGPFSSPFDVTCPADVVSYIIHTLGEDMLQTWQENTLWDSRGRPTKDSNKGKPHEQHWEGEARSLKGIIRKIWDEPTPRVVQTNSPEPPEPTMFMDGHLPFPEAFARMIWNPKAIQADGAYLEGYQSNWEYVLEALPKIPTNEAELLYDLLSKIFVFDPARRPTAVEILDHPWFLLAKP